MWRCVAAAASAGLVWYYGDQLTCCTTLIAVIIVLATLLGTHNIWLLYATLPRDLKGLGRFLKLQFSVRRARKNNLTVPKIFMENVEKHPNKVAFYFENEKWTFAEVDEYCNRVANYFKESGIKHGDSVSIFMENCVEYICIWLGLTKLGAVPALINYNLRAVGLTHSITTSNSTAVICSNDLQEHVKEILQDLPDVKLYVNRTSSSSSIILPGAKNLDDGLKTASTLCPPEIHNVKFGDNMVYIYTSGTTGLPKAAIIKHSRALMAIYGGIHMVSIHSKDVIYSPMPMYHLASGIFGCGYALIGGLTVVVRKKFSVSSYWKECIQYRCTAGQYIGEICRYLLNTPPKPEDTQHKLRIMFGNGLRPEIWDKFKERFNIPLITEFYGATEGNASLINIEGKSGAIGFLSLLVPAAYPCMLIKVDEITGEPIRDKDGVCIRCKPGEPGELVGKIVRNDPIRDFHGYSDKKATSKKIANDVFKKGDVAFMSGDILVMDDEGYLYFKDRSGDTFRWRGENVSTTEVEGIVSKAANNAATVVFGVEIPGSEGRAGMAAIHDPDNTIDLEVLHEGIRKNLPTYARPLFIRKVTKLDMTGTYKLKKIDLKKEAYDMNTIKDQLFVLDMKTGYKPLTHEYYQSIVNGEARL